MNKILRQIDANEVYNVVSIINNEKDLEIDVLKNRVKDYDYYNHIEGFKQLVF